MEKQYEGKERRENEKMGHMREGREMNNKE